MITEYIFIPDLASLITEIPVNSIISKKLPSQI
jgi:hypothetical protein